MTLSKRLLGQTGIEISCLGLGTVKIGRNQEVKYPKTFSIPGDQEVLSLLGQAKELGINLLDTAPAYGSSEQRLGRLLSTRSDWVICSKVGEEFINGKSFYDFSEEHTRNSITRSLRDMKTDYLDIVLIHSDGRDMQILESSDCLETLVKLKEEGLVRAIGMSTKTIEGGLKAAELMDVVMVTYNPEFSDDGEVIEYAAAKNKGVLIKKVFNSGYSQADGRDVAEYNLNYALSKQGVSSIIIGTITPAHLDENVAAAIKATN